MKHYLKLKKTILIHKTWKSLKISMLNQRHEKQKNTYICVRLNNLVYLEKQPRKDSQGNPKSKKDGERVPEWYILKYIIKSL